MISSLTKVCSKPLAVFFQFYTYSHHWEPVHPVYHSLVKIPWEKKDCQGTYNHFKIFLHPEHNMKCVFATSGPHNTASVQLILSASHTLNFFKYDLSESMICLPFDGSTSRHHWANNARLGHKYFVIGNFHNLIL